MGVLSKLLLEERLGLDIDNPKSLCITPLIERDLMLDVDAVDLRLGTHFLLPQVPPAAFREATENQAKHMHVHVPLGKYLVVPAHQTVLGATLEFIKLPFDVSGQILTKSSMARMFMVIETAPWIHPNYRGCLTLEIANVSNTPLLLDPGRTIGQLILISVDMPQMPSKLSGSYLGPTFPEAPRFRSRHKDLRALGVSPSR